MKKEKFKVTGMSCSACSSRVEKVTGKLDGVKTVSVNLLTGTMQIEFDETVTDEEKIIKAVEGAGYGAFPDEGRGGYGEQPGGGNQCGEACATAKGAAARGDGAGGAGGPGGLRVRGPAPLLHSGGRKRGPAKGLYVPADRGDHPGPHEATVH